MATVRHGSREYPPFSSANLTPAERRAVLLHDIDVTIDVGANRGQYALWLRSLGYKGRIISFEPVPETFAALAEAASHDRRWECHNVALGPTDGRAELLIAANSIGSSVYAPTDAHLRLVPEAAEVGRVKASMRSLASLWPGLDCDGGRVFLKVDVEGYELDVLRGALPILDAVALMELEISLAPMYAGAPLLDTVLPWLTERGYRTVALEQNHEDGPTGQMMMVDGLFERRPEASGGR